MYSRMGKTLCAYGKKALGRVAQILSVAFLKTWYGLKIYKIIVNTCGTTWTDSFGTIYNHMYVIHIYIFH